MRSDSLLKISPAGLYCEQGDFYIDPWRPVQRAVITHAHADHARRGMERYLTTTDGVEVLATRMNPGARIDTLPYGESLDVNGVSLSLHPAGHVLGSAQIRVACRGETWVVTGDYKTAPDASCRPFELVPCHAFITESTFGLPIYRWPSQQSVFEQINDWWRSNAERGVSSVVFAYALGKAQRLIAGVDSSIGPIFTHGAVETVNDDYRRTGIELPETRQLTDIDDKQQIARSLIVAPPSAQGSPWIRRCGKNSQAFASGWMLVRGTRRWRSLDRGFVLSDHVDWPQLMETIAATGAERIYPTHGRTETVVRWLTEQGIEAEPLATRFVGESSDEKADDETLEDETPDDELPPEDDTAGAAS